jgi:DNA (cytosine-5)-methyltransferase 1
LPQNRERIFIVCFLDHSIDFVFPEGIKVETKMSDILSEEVDKKYTLSDKMWKSMVERKEKNKKNGKGFGYRSFNADSIYGSTISARYGKDGSEVLIEQENSNPRRLTPLEALRYQGFPSDFEIVVSDTQAYKQFGNSVSVPVIKSIFDCIKIALNKSKGGYFD